MRKSGTWVQVIGFAVVLCSPAAAVAQITPPPPMEAICGGAPAHRRLVRRTGLALQARGRPRSRPDAGAAGRGLWRLREQTERGVIAVAMTARRRSPRPFEEGTQVSK